MLITNDLRDDGFGAQYQSILWTILFSEVNGHEYLYNRIFRMDNDTNDTKKYIQDAEVFMNIRNNYTPIEVVYKREDQTVYAMKVPFFFKEIEKNMELYHSSPSFEKLQRLYFEKKQSPFDDQHIHIAVHIRRPTKFDVSDIGSKVPNTYFTSIMKNLQEMMKQSEKPCLFHIYSQGKPEDFTEYREFPHQLHLEENTFDTFLGMTFADVLVTSPSSFSYVAALLTKGLVVYYPFWHPPRKNWLVAAQQHI